MSNNLFKVPFGFYVENTGFISKRSQIEDLLDGINADAESNAKMDAEQSAKIEANTEAINKEVERSSDLDSKFETELQHEVSERKRMGEILNSKISDVESNLKSLVEETDKAFDVVADELRKKDEALDAKDVELNGSINLVKESLNEEIALRKSADEALTEAIKLNLSEIDEVSSKIDEKYQQLQNDLNAEVVARQEGDNLLTEKVNTLVFSVKEVYDYAKTKDAELVNSIKLEEERAKSVEETKLEWVDLGNGRKSIVLKNHDLILGTDTAGSTSNIAMISKWNVVDLGSNKLPINLNTPSGVRPTVQEAGQSGEQAHKIAYLSDVEVSKSDLSDLVKAEENRAKNAEKNLEDKFDSSVISLNSTLSNMNSTLAILSSTDTALNSRLDVVDSSLTQFKANGIELKSLSALQYVLYVDGVNRGVIDIPKDNFLTNVFVTDDNKLHFVFNVSDVQTDIEVDISKYIDIYTAGKGLSLDSNKFSISINSNSEGYLTVSDNGLSINGIEKDIKNAVSVETDRAIAVEQVITDAIKAEENRAKNIESILETKIIAEESRSKSVEESLAIRIGKVENFEPLILNNQNSINTLTNRISFEENRAKSVEQDLQDNINSIDTLLSNEIINRESKDSELLDIISNEVSIREEKDKLFEESISNIDKKYEEAIAEEASIREEKDTFLEESTNMLSEAISKVNDNYKVAVANERDRAIAVENTKVDWTDLGNDRKSIVLNNHDLILGKTTDGAAQNIAMISKWDIVDLGSSKLPINLNVPVGVRPTVQNSEETNEIAYLSDIEDVKNNIPTVPTKVSAFENDANYLTEHQDLSEYALKSEIPSLDGYVTEEWVESKSYLTEHQDISGLASKDEVNELRELIISLQGRVKELEGRVYDKNQLIELLSSLKEGEELDVTLYSDVIISEAVKMTVPANSTLNLNLNGKTIDGNFDDILFRVNGSMTISGEGTIKGMAYVASVNEGGSVTVMGGNFENEVTSFQANGGTIIVEGGHFETTSKTYGAKYTLNHIDKKKNDGLISVKGGTFVNYNPAESYSENPPMNFVAEGYAVSKSVEGENTIYTVVEGVSLGSAEDFTDLIANLNGDEKLDIYLSNDIIMEGTSSIHISPNMEVNLNLNGNELINKVDGNASIVNEGKMVISNGKISNGSKNSQASASIMNKGEMIIENGEFGSSEQRGAAVENKGQLTINGGTFSSLEKGSDNSNGWAYVFINNDANAVMTINNANSDCNAHGMFAANSGMINVNGGNYRLGANGKTTYYMAYVVDGIINLNGGTFDWTSGATNFPTYIEGSGSVNISENAIINW